MKTKTLGLVLIALVPAGSAGAQHVHAPSEYAHGMSTEVPSLTVEELAELRNGEGMGLARPAELNRYPGPLHTLELAEDLGLDEPQLRAVERVREDMRAGAVALGERLIRAELHLFELFAGGEATPEEVDRMTSHIATMRGELRALHLSAHFEVRRVLRPEQIEAYHRLRGYSG